MFVMWTKMNMIFNLACGVTNCLPQQPVELEDLGAPIAREVTEVPSSTNEEVSPEMQAFYDRGGKSE